MLQQFVSSQLLGAGLYFASFITALLAILSSVSTISGEVSSHQIDTWLMRPISRTQFVLGKFIGLALLMVAYAVVIFFSIILIHQGIGADWMALDISPMQMIESCKCVCYSAICVNCIWIVIKHTNDHFKCGNCFYYHVWCGLYWWVY